MKIRTLLEADLFRMMDGWQNDDTPVLHMKGREARSTHSSMFPTYAFSYGLEQLGIACPKRWRSTFCTTSVMDSSFMDGALGKSGKQGIRKIVPKSGPFGACLDDYNYSVQPVDNMHHMEVISFLQRVEQRLDGGKLGEDVATLWDEADTLVHGIKPLEGSDDGYQKAIKLFHMIDVLYAKCVEAGVLHDDYFTKGMNCTQHIVSQVKLNMEKGNFLVFNTVDEIPDNRNLEVWFEGDYDAHYAPEFDGGEEEDDEDDPW